jgi:hypothetical protein
MGATHSKRQSIDDNYSSLLRTDQNIRAIPSWEQKPPLKKEEDDDDTVYKSTYQKSYVDHWNLQPELDSDV